MTIKYFFILYLFLVSLWAENSFRIYSPDFQNGGIIPKDYTCFGKGVAPKLQWENVPPKAQALALLVDDPDAPGSAPWVHWLVYYIPKSMTSLDSTSQSAVTVGLNSWGKRAYDGPCPPTGIHHYYFRLYALDAPLPLHGDQTTVKEFYTSMASHVVAKDSYMGLVAAKLSSNQ